MLPAWLKSWYIYTMMLSEKNDLLLVLQLVENIITDSNAIIKNNSFYTSD